MDDVPIGSRGFTLIELLLAVGLSALMVGVVMGTYVAIRRGVAESLVRHEAVVEGSGLLHQVMLDLESAYLGNPAFPERFAFEGKVTGTPWRTTRLAFAGTRAGEGGDASERIADLGLITYRLKPVSKEMETFFLYRDVAPLGGQLPAREELLSDRVASFRAVFLDENHRLSRRWDSRARQWRDRLPTLIRIEIVILDQRGGRHALEGQVHPMQDWMR